MSYGAGCTIRILRNTADAAQSQPQMLIVPGSLPELYRQAGKKLGVNVRFAYVANGALLDDIELLRDDELIFCGDTEGFYKNASHASGTAHFSKSFKISIMGPGGVGKSCITIRYTKSLFVETYDPTIEDAFRHQVMVDDRVCVLEILDTAGQEEFLCLAQQWVENKNGFLLVFNVVESSSLLDAERFFRLIQDEYASKNQQRPPVVLVANKIDLAEQRRISVKQGQEASAAWGVEGYVEVSAKTGENIDNAFATLVRAVRRQLEPAAGADGGGALTESRASMRRTGSGGCCLV